MAKPPKKFQRALEYHGARAVVFVLSRLPFGVALWVGRRLGDLLRLVDRRHRQRAEQQSAERLGLNPEESRAFARRNFRNYGMALAEFARLSRMNPENFEEYVDYDGIGPFIREILAEGRGMLLVTAHFGNWEWCNSTARPLGFTGGSIARPLDNARVNEFVRSIRERNGLRIFDKAGAIRKALGALRDNELVGVLIDQDAGPSGLMSPFLGKPASTITIPVELAMRNRSPMVVAVLKRGGVDGKRFTMRYTRTPLRADPDADHDAETRRLVDALNAQLDTLIMEAPDQWFWIHRRWKSVGKS